MNGPSTGRLSFEVQDRLDISWELKISYLRNVFDKGANQLDVAQCIAHIKPLNSPPVGDEHNPTQSPNRKDTANNDSPCPRAWKLS